MDSSDVCRVHHVDRIFTKYHIKWIAVGEVNSNFIIGQCRIDITNISNEYVSNRLDLASVTSNICEFETGMASMGT